jgi:hypothetical protein
MKTTRNLIQICLQCAAMLPGVARAQFQFTIHNDSSLNLYQYIGSGGDVIIIPDATHGCDGLVAVRQKGLREIFQRLREIHALRQLPAIKNPTKVAKSDWHALRFKETSTKPSEIRKGEL